MIFVLLSAALLPAGAAQAAGITDDADQSADTADSAQSADAADDYCFRFPQAGFTITFPEEVGESIMGVLETQGGVELERDCGITMAGMDYYALPEEDYRKITEAQDLSLFAAIRLLKCGGSLFTIYGVDGGRDFSAVNDYLDGSLDEDCAVKIAEAGGYTYYYYEKPQPNIFGDHDAYRENVGEDFYDEYIRLKSLARKAAEEGEYYTPLPTYLDLDGTALAFETSDLNGNHISSSELFASHEITLVNIWASWCLPCITELPALEALNSRIKEQDCAVVGLLLDGDDDDARREAVEILERAGVTYTVLLPPDNLSDFFSGGAIPATFLINRNGEILGDEIRGAQVSLYEKTLKEYLSVSQEN